MIAAAGYTRFVAGQHEDATLNASPIFRWPDQVRHSGGILFEVVERQLGILAEFDQFDSIAFDRISSKLVVGER